MPLLQIIFLLVLLGVLMYLINAYVPMEAKIKNLLNIAVVIIAAIWLITLFVPLSTINTIHVGR
jgi:hypothetical protein